MDVEKKEQVERLKQELRDYLKYSIFIDADEKSKRKRIDIFLDDLSNLLKDD